MKINSFLMQHINLTEKILERTVSSTDKPSAQPKAGDVVKISAEGQKKRVIGAGY